MTSTAALVHAIDLVVHRRPVTAARTASAQAEINFDAQGDVLACKVGFRQLAAPVGLLDANQPDQTATVGQSQLLYRAVRA